MKSNKFIEILKQQRELKMGKVITKPSNIVDDSQLSLTELRAKYPHIRARSTDGFLKKLRG